MVFSLNGQYLLTDYSTPYTFTLDTRRFVDGSYTLAAHALLRDTNSTPDTTVSLTFNNGITTPPVNTKTFTPPQGNPVGPGQTFNVVAAGDGAGGESSESAVTNLMATMNPNLTLYLGDVYEKGTPTEFDNWYGLNQPGNTFYGRFRDITLPTVGNHEYTAGQAPGYFDYWDNTPHYYSVNRHGWHIISLDANSAFNQTAVGTPQYTWLQNDLNSNTQPCTLAFYHQPRYNIGDEGPSTYLDAMWSLMASKGVDLVINGHDHSYQRYVPLDGAGNPSPSGVTEIINGAGGHALGAFPGSDPNLAASAQQFGALKLGLNSAGAAYQFVNTSGSVVDSGSTKCNTSTIDTTSPAAITDLVATSTYKTKIDLTWTPPTDNVGVTRYRIFRDGSLLDTIAAASTYSDTTVTPGSSHSYTVRALDDAGNVAAASNMPRRPRRTLRAVPRRVRVRRHEQLDEPGRQRWRAELRTVRAEHRRLRRDLRRQVARRGRRRQRGVGVADPEPAGVEPLLRGAVQGEQPQHLGRPDEDAQRPGGRRVPSSRSGCPRRTADLPQRQRSQPGDDHQRHDRDARQRHTVQVHATVGAAGSTRGLARRHEGPRPRASAPWTSGPTRSAQGGAG